MTIKRNPIRIPYARPSFLEGMARVVDIGGTLNECDTFEAERIIEEVRARRAARAANPKTTEEAIRETWVAVGKYLYDAMGQFESMERDKLNSRERTQ